MSGSDDLAFTSTTELRTLIAGKQVSPVEVTELYLQRIGRLDSKLNSYLTVTAGQAMDSARDAEAAMARGDDLGLLHGVPISIKDLELTRGVRTTSGSVIFKDRVPTEDSIVVERVKAAGAVVLGKTNTPEFGLLGHTQNRLGDHCRNPWNTERTTGGSSGGAGAAVVAGLCSLATGSDGGGSIRIPASFCGVYGIKPTQHRVPMYGGAASAAVFNMFSQSGPLTRTVADSALLLQVMAGHDPRDAASLRDTPEDYVAATERDVSRLRLAWSPDFGYGEVDPEVVDVASGAARAFEGLGCEIGEADLVLNEPFEPFWTLFCGVVYGRYAAVMSEHRDELSDYARECLERGEALSAVDYVLALGYVDLLRAQFADLFERYDLLLSPTMAVPAFPVGEPPTEIAGRGVDAFSGAFPFTYPINMIGYTAASVPCGRSADGLPIGLQIVGRPGDEATVLAASAAFERARPWADLRPPVS
jgi:Asp-tRNA(Asn)/Glu-tRNA(Gln) amidotransferase A subunit family amidase